MKVAIPLIIMGLLVFMTAAVGLVSVRNVKMSLPELLVGGRSLSRVLLWVLMAGETYTSYTFLGAAGWAYGKGICAFYVFCSFTIACVISYFLLPPIWRVARQNNLMTNADYFAVAYSSSGLGRVTALVGIIALVPFVTLQLTGIQILIQLASYGTVKTAAAAGVAFFMIIAFVFAGGIRGVAWASILKDAMMVGALLFAGIALPVHFLGSPTAMMNRVVLTHPGFMILAGGSQEFGVRWFVSTVCLTACGAFMWPHAFAASYAARDEDSIRWNAVRLPIYQIMLLLVYFAGFTALLIRPGLKGAAVDQSFVLLVQEHYSAWVLGAIAGAGCLAALLPAGTQVLAAASLVTRNVVGRRTSTLVGEEGPGGTRVMIVLVAALAFGLWAFADTTIIGLVLMGYSIVTQLFPGVVFSLLPRRPHAACVGFGLGVAFVVLLAFEAAGLNVWNGINTGLVALVCNAVAVLACDLATSIVGPMWRRKGSSIPTFRET
jgi:solute:Na+ symporter, SSS family